MAETFKGTLKVVADVLLSGGLDVGQGRHIINETYATALTNGIGANQANQLWADTRTIAASTDDDLDLAGGIANAFGTTLTFTSIKGIIVKAASANTNDIILGGASSNAFDTFLGDPTDTIILVPGGTLALFNPEADGYLVAAGTGDILRLTNAAGGTTVTYDIILVGEV